MQSRKTKETVEIYKNWKKKESEGIVVMIAQRALLCYLRPECDARGQKHAKENICCGARHVFAVTEVWKLFGTL